MADGAQLFLTEIGRRATLRTADLQEVVFLYQRISVAIREASPANNFNPWGSGGKKCHPLGPGAPRGQEP